MEKIDNISILLNQKTAGIVPGSTNAKVDLVQDSTTAAIPPLQLTQADIDQAALKVVGTATTGVLSQTIVDSSNVSTISTTAFIKVNISDSGSVITSGDYYIPVYTIA